MYPLVLEKVSKFFGGLEALRDVSLSVEEGELHAIIGPNGAGKTTLFNLISGSLRPSAGHIYLFGQDVTKMPCHRRSYLGLGRTFQITNLFLNLTVLQNVALALQAQRRMKLVLHRSVASYSFLEARAKEILAEQGLGEKSNSLAKNLSYGEQRQMDVILALAQEPKMLLLDEPTSGLSRVETNTFKEFIRTIGEGRTIMLIEHDMDVAFSMANRVTVLHQGSVFAIGSPDDIKHHAGVTEIYLGEEEV